MKQYKAVIRVSLEGRKPSLDKLKSDLVDLVELNISDEQPSNYSVAAVEIDWESLQEDA